MISAKLTNSTNKKQSGTIALPPEGDQVFETETGGRMTLESVMD